MGHRWHLHLSTDRRRDRARSGLIEQRFSAVDLVDETAETALFTAALDETGLYRNNRVIQAQRGMSWLNLATGQTRYGGLSRPTALERYFRQASRDCGCCIAAVIAREVRAAIDIPVVQFPVIKSSSIQIITPYPGATAESVKALLPSPLSALPMPIPGVDYVESTTTSGESIVTAWMQLNEDSTDALAELSSGLSQIRLELPDGAEDPFIQVSRADSPYASFYLAVRVPEDRPLGEVTDIVQRNIVPQLTSVQTYNEWRTAVSNQPCASG